MNKESRTRKALSKIVDKDTKQRKTTEFQQIVSTMYGEEKTTAIKKLASEIKKPKK